MNIRFLETAVWLAHYRSFRITAERLNITQAAISSRIATMEQELGVRLFDRQSRDVVLTKEGEEFVRGARDIVERYEALTVRLRTSSEIEGLVRLGLVSSMAHTLLPDIARTLRENHPSVRFEVTTDTATNLAELLDNNKLDVCLTVASELVPERLEVRPLCTLGMFWVASPILLPNSNEQYSTLDLSRFPLISYATGALNAERISSYLGDNHGAEHIVHASNSLATTIHMTVSGVGIAVMPPVVIQRELREGLLHVLNVDPLFWPTSYVVLYSPLRDTRNAVRIAAIAQSAAQRLCDRFDPSLASIPSPVAIMEPL